MDDGLDQPISDTSEEPQAAAARLLAPLDEGQQYVVDVVAKLFFETTGAAPTAQFVVRKLEHAGFDGESVLASFPRAGWSSYRHAYGAWTDARISSRGEIGLTAVGLFHCTEPYRAEAHRTIDGLLSVLRWLAEREAAFVPAPFERQDLEVTHHDVLAFLEWTRWLRGERRKVSWSTALVEFFRGRALPADCVRLFCLMEREPLCWFMRELDGRPHWYIRLDTYVRHYAGVGDLHDYVTAIASDVVRRPDQSVVRPPELPLPIVLDHLDCT